MKSQTLTKYKNTMHRVFKSIYPDISQSDLDKALDYSIRKRYKEETLNIHNNYNHKNTDMSLLAMCDYILSREPIITSYGVLFKKHTDVENPQNRVVDDFIALRKKDKAKMFEFPKGSGEYNHYNLLQNLDKIDTNAIYG